MSWLRVVSNNNFKGIIKLIIMVIVVSNNKGIIKLILTIVDSNSNNSKQIIA